MKNKIVRLLVVLLIAALTSVVLLVNANAASATLYFSDPTVTVGNNVSVVVTIKGQDIAGYQMNVSYDKGFLKFVSATGNTGNFVSSENSGVIRVVDNLGSGSADKMTFTLTFKTLKTGTTKITPSECMFGDGSGDPITPSALGDSTITIKPVPEASSDANLKGLSIEGGALSPEFNANTTEYSATVDFSVTSLAVSAVKNHNGASVYVAGNDALAVGENNIVITVTAENGAKKTYTIKVTRGKNPLSSDIFVKLTDDATAEVSITIDPERVPKGFELKKITVADKEIDALFYDERALPAVYVLGNENVAENFYYINVGDMTIKPFEYVGSANTSLTVLDITLAETPEGYELGKFTFGETEKDVLIPKNVETPNHCLVYAIGLSGEKTLYMYDPIENTYQRYLFAEVGETEAQPSEDTKKPSAETKDPQKDQEDKKDDKSLFSNAVFKISFIVIAALIIVLGAIGVWLAIKSKR